MGFRLFPEAESDLDVIWLYVAKKQPEVTLAIPKATIDESVG